MIERARLFSRYRAALTRYRAARADLGAQIEAGVPPTNATMRYLNDAESALSEAWRAYVEADPLVRKVRSKAASH
jgi:hypothetical protein